MRTQRYIALITMMAFLIALLWNMGLPTMVTAQDADVGTPPAIIAPGVPLSGFGGTAVPTLPYTQCYEPLRIEVGQIIFIESGVNIRSAPSGSSAIVWNTVVNSREEDGTIENPIQVIATVIGGPVCDTGSNWWQVRLPGNDGWVSEGRPYDQGGYLVNSPGLFDDLSCDSPYTMRIGQYADLLLDARVRTEPHLDGRVRTVAPAGTPVLIIGGPQCIDTILWWHVRVEVVDFIYEGWMAEGAEGKTWLIPDDAPSTEDGTLCNDPLAFELGERAYVSSLERLPRTLRAAPGVESQRIFTVVDGVPFIIEGGPVCASNLNWWQVRILSTNPVVGWIAEGSKYAGFWISAVDPDEYGN